MHFSARGLSGYLEYSLAYWNLEKMSETCEMPN